MAHSIESDDWADGETSKVEKSSDRPALCARLISVSSADTFRSIRLCWVSFSAPSPIWNRMLWADAVQPVLTARQVKMVKIFFMIFGFIL